MGMQELVEHPSFGLACPAAANSLHQTGNDGTRCRVGLGLPFLFSARTYAATNCRQLPNKYGLSRFHGGISPFFLVCMYALQ